MLGFEPGDQLMFEPTNGSGSETHPLWNRLKVSWRSRVAPIKPGGTGNSSDFQSFLQAKDTDAHGEWIFHVVT